MSGEFKQGDKRINRKGRPRGSRNRDAEMIRRKIKDFVYQTIDEFREDYHSLKPQQRIMMFEKLLRHVLPRPVDELERLSDEDLDRLIERLKNRKL